MDKIGLLAEIYRNAADIDLGRKGLVTDGGEHAGRIFYVTAYQNAEKTYPCYYKHRVQSMPKDAFHFACISHKTRLNNVLRTPGLTMTERALYQQRIANMTTAQSIYLAKQKEILDTAT